MTFVVEGNAKWKELGDKSIFDDDPILLQSYMEAIDKKHWRPGYAGKAIKPSFRFKNKSHTKFSPMTTRQIANKLGISRVAAWDRIRLTMKSWGVTREQAAAIVLKGFNHQSRAKVKITPGMRFGRLTTIRVLEYDERPQNVSAKYLKQHYWLCKCDCGKKTSVVAEKLRSGHTKSCGCLRIDMIKQRSKDNARKDNT